MLLLLGLCNATAVLITISFYMTALSATAVQSSVDRLASFLEDPVECSPQQTAIVELLPPEVVSSELLQRLTVSDVITCSAVSVQAR